MKVKVSNVTPPSGMARSSGQGRRFWGHHHRQPRQSRANAVVTFNVPDDAVVIGNPAHYCLQSCVQGAYGLPDHDVPDDLIQEIAKLREELAKMAKDR